MASRDEVLRWGQQALQEAGITDCQSDAWLLYEFVCKCSRAHFLLEKQEEMPEGELEAYKALIQKRCSRIPLQYIVGTQEFMGFSFVVNEHVLIPRMETELLVLEVEKYLQERTCLLDLCTGSGCIAVSLKKRNPKLCVSAADISKDALCVARENSRLLGGEVAFYCSDLFELFKQSELFPQKPQFDIIVSNPPYIPSKVMEELEEEVRLHEPGLALDGAEDGLEFYRRITRQSRSFLSRKGMLFYEIGHDQGDTVSGIMEKEGFHNINVIKDFAGLDRIVYGGIEDV